MASLNDVSGAHLSEVTPWTGGKFRLASILFLIYVNDLPDALSGSVLLFADDVKLISAGSQYGELHQNLEAAFQWAGDCDRPLNASPDLPASL